MFMSVCIYIYIYIYIYICVCVCVSKLMLSSENMSGIKSSYFELFLIAYVFVYI